MGKFTFLPTGIEGLTVIETGAFGDERGYFMETYNRREFADAGLSMTFVQDNQSMSRRGVLRGLHMQVGNPQGKLVRAVSGEVFDVAVDMRRDSPTLGRWYGVTLSAANRRQFYIPEGFAHGFLVLSDTAEFCYKCTRLYAPGDELGVRYDDPDVGVAWPDCGAPLTLSPKDLAQPSYKEACRRLFGEK
ncbi:MAG: dTDP-4-dehydrorhamnose 3,5-epimerase [Oscillospiraceae bacterium]|nr:dTDP-4-dehydrorhamnose 3,5-epimerase [Oscillospiraceae bacterium]